MIDWVEVVCRKKLGSLPVEWRVSRWEAVGDSLIVHGGVTRLKKPYFGDKCNQCGYCCEQEPCSIAKDFLNCHDGPCIALEQLPDGRKICGMVQRPANYMFPTERVDLVRQKFLQKLFANALGVGTYCDATD
jgi:hypothetical protein